MTLRTRIAAAFSALSVLAVAGSVHAQFSPPTCVPPNCSPEVIQNIAVSGAAQSASINITGSGKMGGTFQTGALAPVLTAATDNLYYGNVGGTSTNGALLLLQFGSADRFRVTLTGQQQLPLGSAAAPSYSFGGDTNTGIYSQGADILSFATGGVSRMVMNSGGIYISNGQLTMNTAGTAASPAYSFNTDTNTGMYRSAADTLNLATNGISRFQIDPNGAVLIPGSLTVQGTFTASGGVGGDGSALTNLNASNITTGTLNDARLSTNVATYSGGGTFTGVNTFSNAGNSFTGNGAGLTSLNASNISSGTLADGRLSANVALLDRANQTFTGSNNFTGMTSYGSEALVAGAAQNLMYGVVDGTSTGSLMLLQTEAAGVYTDRFRVTAAGAVTAASFSGVGTNLTALNATNLTSGTVPSARISGTYANSLTFSNRTLFGSATLNVAAGQSLLYGNVDTASLGNLIQLQNEGVDRFRVDAAGNLYVAGTITATGTLTSGGQNVCVQDGTNCPPTVGGSGTANYVTKFTGPDSVGVSQIQDNGANIGLGGAPDASYLARVYGSLYANSVTATSVNTYLVAAGAAGVTGQVVGVGSYGVVGSGGSYGVYGSSGGYGVYGYNTSAGGSGAGVYGYHGGTGPGVQGSSASGWGGSFSSLYVTPGTSYFASAVTLNGGASLGAGSLLTLGSAAADPSGANGAMYYSTASNGFRCYANGAWGSCGGVGGTGTTNYVPKFTGASTIGNSQIRDDGTGVSIGGTPAGTALTVIGPTNLSNALTATTNAANGVGIYGFGMGSSSIGVYGQGQGSGVSGVAGGVSGVGLQGTGNYAGVTGSTTNVWGYGVQGSVPVGSFAYGVYGVTPSTQYSSAGVAGINTGNGRGGYFQSSNATTYALAVYNSGNPATGFAIEAQGASSFVGNVNVTNVLGVAGLLNSSGNNIFGDAAADTLTIWGTTVTTPNNLNFDANTLFIDATNNRVGMGTITPQRQLSIYHATDAVAQLTNATAGTASGDGLLLIQSGLNAFVENGEAGNLSLRTSATDRVIIDSSGNVGVGYAPSYKLDVNGRGFFNGEIAVGGDISSVWTGYGVASSGTASGGHFYNTNYPSVYGSNGYASSGDRYGVYGSAIDSTGTVKYAGYFNAGGSGTNYGVYANGSTYGVYANGSSYGLRAAASTYGVYSTATYAGYFGGSGGAYAWAGYNSNYGIYAYAPTNGYGVYASGYYGVYGEGAVRGGHFYDTGGTAQTFIAGASWGVEIITGGAVKPGGGSWSAPSDRRTKEDIHDFKDGLSVIRELNPVNYTYNGLGGTPAGQKGIGFIAQEVEPVAPYLIQHQKKKLHPDDLEDTDMLLVDPSAITYINMNAIKELDLKIVGLEAKIKKIDEVDARVRALERRVERLEEELDALRQAR